MGLYVCSRLSPASPPAAGTARIGCCSSLVGTLGSWFSLFACAPISALMLATLVLPARPLCVVPPPRPACARCCCCCCGIPISWLISAPVFAIGPVCHRAWRCSLSLIAVSLQSVQFHFFRGGYLITSFCVLLQFVFLF